MGHKKTAVFASGMGETLQAILDAGVQVDLAIVDRPCRAQNIARGAGVECVKVLREDFTESFDRTGYSKRVLKVVQSRNIELVALAGFMTVLAAEFFEGFEGITLNVHPSILPHFPGDKAVAESLEHWRQTGEEFTGCTVHFAIAQDDAGEVLGQVHVPPLPDDTEHTLHKRIKKEEQHVYPQWILALAQRND